jgi:hypothetical protein
MIREIPPRGHKHDTQQESGQKATRDGQPGKG